MFGLCETITMFVPASGAVPASLRKACARRSFSIGVTTSPPSVMSLLEATSPPPISFPVSTARLKRLVYTLPIGMPSFLNESPTWRARTRPPSESCRCFATLSRFSGSVSAWSRFVAPWRKTMTYPPLLNSETIAPRSVRCAQVGPASTQRRNAMRTRDIVISVFPLKSTLYRVGYGPHVMHAAEIGREHLFLGGALDGRHEARRGLRLPEMLEHHRRRPERRDRIGDALAGDVERRSVDRLEHRGEFAFRIQVRGGRDAERAGERRSQVGKNVGVQVARDDRVDGSRLEHHPRGHRIHEDAIRLHVRVFRGDFVKDFIPQHHAVALRVRLGDERQVLARPFARQLEGEAVDPFHAGTREHGNFGGNFIFEPGMNSSARARVLALGVLADDDPVDLACISQVRSDSREETRGADVGVLVEALADRQAQAPEGNVVRHVGRADRAEQDGVELLQLVEPAVRDVGAFLLVALRAPVEGSGVEGKAFLGSERLQDFQSRWNDFVTDTVARNGGDAVRLQAAFLD